MPTTVNTCHHHIVYWVQSPPVNLIFNVNNSKQPQTSLCQWVYLFKETGSTIKHISPAEPHGVWHISGYCVYRAQGNLLLISVYLGIANPPTYMCLKCMRLHGTHELSWVTKFNFLITWIKSKHFVFQETDANEDLLTTSPFYRWSIIS